MPSRVVCFVCGSFGGQYQLYNRPREGSAYFPFLEHHDPPKGSRIPGSDGAVDACGVCFSFLTQQWESYERQNTPAIKRLYWLKRQDDGQFTGAEMKIQGEYMAQVMGLQYQPSCGENCGPLSPDETTNFSSRDGFGMTPRDQEATSRRYEEREGVLDLSVPVKSETSSKCSSKSGYDVEKNGLKPAIDDFSFVCFTCGLESHGVGARILSSSHVGPNEPYFPFLAKIAPSPGSAPLSSQGACKVCDHCFSSLCHQWLTYEQHATPNSARIFKVKDSFFSNDSSIVTGGPTAEASHVAKEVCYLCSQLWAATKMGALFTVHNGKKDSQMYFPFIRELRRPQGARPLNPDGSVRVCVSCYGNLQGQWQRYETESVPLLQRRYSLLPVSSGVQSRSLSLSAASVSSEPPDTRILTIKREEIPTSLTKPLNIDVSDSLQQSKSSTNYLSANHALSGPSSANQSPKTHASMSLSSGDVLKSSATAAPTSATGTIPHPLAQAGERPKKVCFLCGEKCLAIRAKALYSHPVRTDNSSLTVQSQVIPFFPFLANQEPASGADNMTEEGSVLSCSYCYHSLLNQWRDYEESKGPSDKNRWLRKYTLSEFVCFVCGTSVRRRKMRTLEVEKFPFLREHSHPPSALVMWGGEAVGACGTCNFSLTHQYADFERLGLPVELRKYNWTVQHHIDENSCDTQDSVQRATSMSGNEDSNLSVADVGEDSNTGLPPGSKPPLPMMSPVQAAMSAPGKLPPKTATVPPLHQVPPSNGLSSASLPPTSPHTSSFAAALRKLAHQVKEPIAAEEPLSKHSGSPPSTAHSPRSVTPKRPPLMFPAHSAGGPSSLTSPPVVTIAPTPAHHHQAALSSVTDLKQSCERLPTSLTGSLHETGKHEPRDQRDQRDQRPSSSLSREEAPGKDTPLSRSHSRLSQPSSGPNGVGLSGQALDLYARQLQALRAEEEAARLSLPYGLDPASYAAAAAAYHPALLQQQAAFAHNPFRFDDPLLLERYRMLQSPYLQYAAAQGGLLSPHTAAAGALGMHPMMARYPADLALLQQQYSYLGQGHPLLDPRLAAQAALLERSRQEEDKARELIDKEREKERDREREKSVDRELERERERRLNLEKSARESQDKEQRIRDRSRDRSESERRSAQELLDRQDMLERRSAQDLSQRRDNFDRRETSADRRDLLERRSASEMLEKRDSLDRRTAHDLSDRRENGNRRSSHDLSERRDAERRAQQELCDRRDILTVPSRLPSSSGERMDARLSGTKQNSPRHGAHSTSHPPPLSSQPPHLSSQPSHLSSQPPPLSSHPPPLHSYKDGTTAVNAALVKPHILGKTVEHHHSVKDSTQQHSPSYPSARTGFPPPSYTSPPHLVSAASIANNSHPHHSPPNSHRTTPRSTELSPSSTHHNSRRSSDSTGGIFRPFDDDVKSSETAHNSKGLPFSHDIPPPLYSRSALKPSLPHHQLPKRHDLSTSVTLSKSSDILTIPSVKVHPQRHGPTTHMVDSSASSHTTSTHRPPHTLGSNSQLKASPQYATTKVISNCINNRIERFDFKSLAQECTAGSEDKLEAAAAAGEVTGVSSDTFVEESRPAVSKLDLEERRLKNKRGRTEEEGIEDEERQEARLTMVGRVTPLPLDTPPEKMRILEYLGVSTLRKREDLRQRRESRRRHRLRMSSLSPVQRCKDDEISVDWCSPGAQLPLLPELGPFHPDAMCAQPDVKEKTDFLSNLGLSALDQTRRTELQRKRLLRMALLSLRRNELLTSRTVEGLNLEGSSGLKRKYEEVSSKHGSRSCLTEETPAMAVSCNQLLKPITSERLLAPHHTLSATPHHTLTTPHHSSTTPHQTPSAAPHHTPLVAPHPSPLSGPHLQPLQSPNVHKSVAGSHQQASLPATTKPSSQHTYTDSLYSSEKHQNRHQNIQNRHHNRHSNNQHRPSTSQVSTSSSKVETAMTSVPPVPSLKPASSLSTPPLHPTSTSSVSSAKQAVIFPERKSSANVAPQPSSSRQFAERFHQSVLEQSRASAATSIHSLSNPVSHSSPHSSNSSSHSLSSHSLSSHSTHPASRPVQEATAFHHSSPRISRPVVSVASSPVPPTSLSTASMSASMLASVSGGMLPGMVTGVTGAAGVYAGLPGWPRYSMGGAASLEAYARAREASDTAQRQAELQALMSRVHPSYSSHMSLMLEEKQRMEEEQKHKEIKPPGYYGYR